MRTLCASLLATLAMCSVAEATGLKAGDYLVTNGLGDGLITADEGIFGIDRTTGNQYVVSKNGVLNGVDQGVDMVDPYGIVVGPGGEIYVSDPAALGNAGAIFRIDPLTGQRTVVFTGSGDFQEPYGIALDSDGMLIVTNGTSSANASVGRINPATGALEVITSASSPGDVLERPAGVALDPDGSIVLADYVDAFMFNGMVVRVNPASGAQTVVSASYSTSQDPNRFQDPTGIAFLNGSIFVLDVERILMVDPLSGARTRLTTDEAFGSFNLLSIDDATGMLLFAGSRTADTRRSSRSTP